MGSTWGLWSQNWIRVAPRNPCFNQLSRWFWCSLKFERDCVSPFTKLFSFLQVVLSSFSNLLFFFFFFIALFFQQGLYSFKNFLLNLYNHLKHTYFIVSNCHSWGPGFSSWLYLLTPRFLAGFFFIFIGFWYLPPNCPSKAIYSTVYNCQFNKQNSILYFICISLLGNFTFCHVNCAFVWIF